MPQDKTTLFRQAMILCKDDGNITVFTENHPVANVCRIYWDMVRDAVLRSAPWPSARKTALLAPVSERAEGLPHYIPNSPELGFRYRYAAPSDIIQPMYSPNWARFNYLQGRYIDTNTPAPFALHYLSRSDEVETWDSALYEAVLNYLAAHLAIFRTGDANLAQLYYLRSKEISDQAGADFANQSEEYYESIPSWIAARGYSGIGERTRFFYPFQSLSPVVGI